MTTRTIKQSKKQVTLDDLKGLRAEAYIRDSTLDQSDGFGPDIQRNNEERFARNYGLLMGNRWYTEFVSGRSVKKRLAFQQFIEDAGSDLFDVLLVDHTSRFGRNQAECIQYKEELHRLGKTVIFVSQGIISGSDKDFLSERINETLDEQYSRNLSRYVSAGMAEKAKHGLANGLAPFGYRSELVGERRREKKVIDQETMPALLMMLRDYATGNYSNREVADRLNASGYRTKKGNPLTGYFVRDILSNRFYDGKVIYHDGQPDEKVFEGIHEIPDGIRRLWRECQNVKNNKLRRRVGRPRAESRSFPFSTVLKCHYCRQPYYGEAVNRGEWIDLRLAHERYTAGRACHIKPRSRSVTAVKEEFQNRVLPCLNLPISWKEDIVEALRGERGDNQVDIVKRTRIETAINNIRKQHKWGDINDEEYLHEKLDLDRQLKSLNHANIPINMPNLERASKLIEDLPSLWSHPGVNDSQREALIKNMFTNITIGGKNLISIEPKPEYASLFATIVMSNSKIVENRKMDSPPPPPETQTGLELIYLMPAILR
ncbi:recombinase family protein [Chloroflexota bacterium]